MYKKYCIKYKVLLEGASPPENKEIKIDRCMSGLHAQTRLETYLRKKYVDFKGLEVLSCSEDGNLMSMFGDIFGGDLSKMFGGRK